MNVRDAVQPRVRELPPSGIRKFFDLVGEMRDAISLSVGEPDFVTPWRIREAGIYSLERGRTHYSPNAGLLRLREAAAAYLKRRLDLSYDPRTQILITVGGSEAIDLALRALAGPGDEVIIPEPCFVSYKPCAILAGATPVVLPLSAENGFKLAPEQLARALSPRSKVLIFPYPNNPTGATMGRAELERLLPVLAGTGLIIVSDEIYSELSYAGRHVSVASLPGLADRTVVINGFSKSHAMTGWRLGYAAGHPDLVAAMHKIHQYAIMCSPSVSQYAGIEALENCDAEVEEMVREYNRRRRLTLDGFRAAGLDCLEPTGAFYVFPGIGRTGLSSLEFCERLLRERKVAVIPGSAFGEAGEGHIRACYAYSPESIREALSRIRAFVDDCRR